MADWLITGVSSGLGRGLVRAALARGHRVWGLARREELLARLAQEAGTPAFRYAVCDVADPAAVAATAHVMEAAGFVPDTVVLNAAVNPERHGSPFAMAEFEHVVRVNLFGALAWVERYLPLFTARGRGHFVAISSLAAFRGDARWVAYGASKAALSRAFEALRGRHHRDGLRFTTIHLGAVATGMGTGARSPFRLGEAQAVERIMVVIERGGRAVTIPRILRVPLELMRVLPDPVFSRLVGGAFARSGGAPARPTPPPAPSPESPRSRGSAR